MNILDAFGKQCPMPLMMAKKELDVGTGEFGIQVDNETAVKNVTRLAEKEGVMATTEKIDGGWLITFTTEDTTGASACTSSAASSVNAPESIAAGAACGPGGCGYAVFIGKDHVGEGDGELGYNLMKMALYTLSQADIPPASLLFMNSGVKLVAGDEQQIIDSVLALQAAGTEVLVCGTCLDFYNLKEQLRVGEVSNMYDILGRMHEAAKVITL